MLNLSLNEKEVELVKKSINHCLSTCKNNNGKEICPDCTALVEILKKLQ